MLGLLEKPENLQNRSLLNKYDQQNIDSSDCDSMHITDSNYDNFASQIGNLRCAFDQKEKEMGEGGKE